MELDFQNLQEDNAEEIVDDSVSDSSSESEPYGDDDESEQEVVPMEAQVAECIKTMQDAMELLQEQAAKGNEKFVERFISSNKPNYTLLAEVKKRRNKRTMTTTWGKSQHPATMYLKLIIYIYIYFLFFFFILFFVETTRYYSGTTKPVLQGSSRDSGNIFGLLLAG